MPDTIFEQVGPVAWLTFNRPEARNAMTWEMYETLRETCERVDEDPDTRVLVLRGAGDKAFASGTDIRQFLEFKTREDALGYEERINRSIGRVADMRKPVIAAINGDAVGGGMFLALACDLLLAAEHVRFGVPVARTLGNFPNPKNLAQLIATIGVARARNLVLTARLIDAQEALRVGLVDEVLATDQLEDRARELANRIATLAPLTLSAVKEAARRVSASAFTIPDAEELMLSCYLSQDFQEGVRAFLEKRTSEWQGK
jgi:enoyl-CoA hydratase/carnithine racemase